MSVSSNAGSETRVGERHLSMAELRVPLPVSPGHPCLCSRFVALGLPGPGWVPSLQNLLLCHELRHWRSSPRWHRESPGSSGTVTRMCWMFGRREQLFSAALAFPCATRTHLGLFLLLLPKLVWKSRMRFFPGLLARALGSRSWVRACQAGTGFHVLPNQWLTVDSGMLGFHGYQHHSCPHPASHESWGLAAADP